MDKTDVNNIISSDKKVLNEALDNFLKKVFKYFCL